MQQSLTDLLSRLEGAEIPYDFSGRSLTQAEIDIARAEVAKDMGW